MDLKFSVIHEGEKFRDAAGRFPESDDDDDSYVYFKLLHCTVKL